LTRNTNIQTFLLEIMTPVSSVNNFLNINIQI